MDPDKAILWPRPGCKPSARAAGGVPTQGRPAQGITLQPLRKASPAMVHRRLRWHAGRSVGCLPCGQRLAALAQTAHRRSATACCPCSDVSRPHTAAPCAIQGGARLEGAPRARPPVQPGGMVANRASEVLERVRSSCSDKRLLAVKELKSQARTPCCS